MSTIVRISCNLILYSDHPYSEGWWLVDDVYDWLRLEVGQGAQSGVVVANDVWRWIFVLDTKGHPVQNWLMFDHKIDAIRFKLVWT